MTSVLCCVLTTFAALISAPADRAVPRYDLRVGDRLIFRTTLDIETAWPGRLQSIRAGWSTHLLVVAKERDAWLVGIARNRTRAELVRSFEDGRNASAKHRSLFDERISRMPARFFDANRFDRHGALRLPPKAIREWPSEALLETRELPALPTSGREIAGSLLDMRWTAFEQEEVDGVRCVRVEARGAAASILRYWFVPSTSLPRRIEFTAEYPEPSGARSKLEWTSTLVERRREQSLAFWLWDPDTRLAALEALRHADAPYIEPQRLAALTESGDLEALRLGLSLAHRLGQAPFTAAALAQFMGCADPRIRTLGKRVQDEITASAKRPRTTGLHPEERKAAQPFGARMHQLARAESRDWPYIVHVPDDYRGDEPVPLLIYLSGGFGRAYTGAMTSREAIADKCWLAVFPQARGMWWNAATTEMMDVLLSALGRRFNIDWNRVYIAGFSNGASGAFYYATLWPHRFAAVVSMMGAGAHVPGVYRAPAENAAALPMLFLHGDQDDVVPLASARATVAALRRADREAPVEIQLLRGRGHDIALDRCDGLALSFLERHVRDPFPRHVRLRLRDLRYPRRYWVEILEKAGKVAEVEAEVGAGNIVRLRCGGVRRLLLLMRRELLPDQGPLRVLVGERKVWDGPLPEIEEARDSKRRTGDPYLDAYSPIEVDLGEENIKAPQRGE